MKHAVWLLLGILCSAMLLIAQDKGMKMTGTICNSACVVHQNNLPTCDPQCTDKSGDAVFIDDQGKVVKVANQDMCKSHMGKKVTMMAVPTEKQREESVQIMELYDQAP